MSQKFSDEFILQNFIEKLKNDVDRRKVQLDSLIRKANSCALFEKSMQSKIRSV
jgi:hypothetical protein